MILEVLLINWQIVLLFFIVAILYSSVGFGGGSSYLAILALTSLAFTEIRATALLCNIMVVVGNVYFYNKRKLYHWKKVIPLVLVSIPFAFIGGYLKITQSFFYVLLGFTLLFAAISMWLSKNIKPKHSLYFKFKENAFFGGCIGFLSGLVGIGGGIFLAPFLHITNWSTPKKIAATASFFILVNSISGLIGQVLNPDFNIDWTFSTVLLATVFVGGQIGNRFSNRLLNPIKLKRATAILIAFVSIKILINHI